jgi:hypothetical protein
LNSPYALLPQPSFNYTYDESGTGLLYIREVVGGTKIRFHWEGYDLYLEEVQSGSTWISKYASMNQPVFSARRGTDMPYPFLSCVSVCRISPAESLVNTA